MLFWMVPLISDKKLRTQKIETTTKITTAWALLKFRIVHE
jgi:hypothetical protein